MESNVFRYFLFPHTSLSEGELRHFSILLPHLSLFQVVRTPTVPLWAKDQFPIFPAISEQAQIEQIKSCLQGYQELGTFYGEDCILASISHESSLKESREARFQIQGELRGRKIQAPDLRQVLLLEAATFLEMALDLDEKERDLEASFARVEALEGEFRRIIGASEGEEIDKDIESLTSPLTTGKANISFMLSKRMSFWFRLFSNHSISYKPVLVTIVKEAVEELFDPLLAEYDRNGKPLRLTELSLASLPSLDHLSGETFLSLAQELRETGTLNSYRESLENVLREPHEPAIFERLAGAVEALQAHIKRFLSESGTVEQKQVSLTLGYTKDCSYSDLWRRLDREGHKAMEKEEAIRDAPSIFLHLA